MRPRVEGGSEDETQPFQVGQWIEELVLKLHREGAWRLIGPGSSPVHQLSFWDGEGDVDWGGLLLNYD